MPNRYLHPLPIILSFPDSIIYSLDDGAPQPITYDQAHCVHTYRLFLNNRQRSR